MSNKRFRLKFGRITSDGLTFETLEHLNVPNFFFIDLSWKRKFGILKFTNCDFEKTRISEKKKLESSKKRFVISY